MWFNKKKWGHCKTFKIDHRYNYRDGWIYIHLYESKTGNRRFEVGSTHKELSNWSARRHVIKTELYHERVVRWLGGRHDTEIPSYQERAVDDTANALKNVNE